MKVYDPQPAILVRLQIVQQGSFRQYITLCECDVVDVFAMLDYIIVNNASPIIKGKRTSVHVRQAIGAKNGKSKSVSFYGIPPEIMKNLIIDYISKL